MPLLFGSTTTLVVAALLLVIVASLPAIETLVAGWTLGRAAVPVIALLAGMTLIHKGLDAAPVLPQATTSSIVRNAILELEQAAEPNVIVVDGGSYAFNAVDTEILEAELRALGYESRAIRIAAGGINHFERFHMQDSALRRVRRQAQSNQRWLYLAEVQQGYDTAPLAQFEKNQDTIRAYSYLTPRNGWHAARALLAEDSTPPLDAWRWPLLRHVMINASNTGVAHRLVAERDVPPRDGTVLGDRPGRFKFDGLRKVSNAAKKRPPKVAIPSWLARIREPRSRRLWRRFGAELVYFGVPTTTRGQLDYVRNFCAGAKVPCLDPADMELLQSLSTKKSWRNATHLTVTGSRAYSRWLAKSLVEARVLRHP